MSELYVLLDNRRVGTIRQTRGRLSFIYDDAWRGSPASYPLSLSMPLSAAGHGHNAIDRFLWGLLPDNELILRRWAQRFHVSARNAFALIAEVGEDCPGAARFVRPERLEAMMGAQGGAIAWLTEADVAQRLREVRTDASMGRRIDDEGRFSLAGAQPKTALVFDGQRWGIPSGSVPTTHILKPAATGFDGHAENEHLCLALARALGLPTVRSEVRYFEDVATIVIERYDRIGARSLADAARALQNNANAVRRTADVLTRAADFLSSGDAVVEAAQARRALDMALNNAETTRDLAASVATLKVPRVHQEDMCQALGVHPSRKYQNEGGPGPGEILNLLRTHAHGNVPAGESRQAANEDSAIFVDSLIMNWLIGGTDAHAKNYSLLLGGGGHVRLAPLYDLASIYGYPASIDPDGAKLAMKIGGEYRLRDIGLPQWRKFATETRSAPDRVVERIRSMADELPDRLADEIRRLAATGVTHSVIDTMARELPHRAAAVSAF